MTWADPLLCRDPGGGAGRFYAYYENRSGNDYVHYQYGDEADGSACYYRRGLLNSDGSISWSAVEQVAVAGAAGIQMAVEGLAVDPFGRVMYFYGRCPIGDYANINYSLTVSNTTDGTWVTHTDYPKLVKDPYGVVTEGLIVSVPGNYSAYMVLNPGSGDYIQGKLLDDNVLGSLENVSQLHPESARVFSIVGYEGNVHVLYREDNDDYRYCWRNFTSGNWEVQDELVTDYVASTTWQIPIISYDTEDDEPIVTWWTESDASCWITFRESGSWTSRVRIFRLPEDTGITSDAYVVIPYGHHFVSSFIVGDTLRGRSFVWCYRYPTEWSELFGDQWNTVFLWGNDYNKNFTQVNASLVYDSVSFTYFVVEWTNGTQCEFIYGQTQNVAVVITLEAVKIHVWATVDGSWSHYYS